VSFAVHAHSEYSNVIDTYFDHINIDDGLSSNIVKGVVEDKNGFIWFGTSNGLNRYDGKNISIFQHDPNIPGSLSDNHVSTLFVDSQGTMWVGTMQGGLCRLREDGTFDIFKHNLDDPTSISHNQIWCIYEDSRKHLWIGTQMGLNRMDRHAGTFERFTDIIANSDEDAAVLSITEDKAGRMWIGTWTNGLYLLIPEWHLPRQDKITFLPVSQNTQKLGSNNVWTLHTDSRGQLWVGVYHGGVYLMNPPDCDDYYTCAPEDFTFKTVKHHRIDRENNNAILSFWEDEQSNLYIGHDLGLSGIQLNNFYKYPDKNSLTFFDFLNVETCAFNRQVNDIYQDNNGLIWVAHAKGVHKYFGNQLKFKKQLNSFCLNNETSVTSFCTDEQNDKLWIGISGEGLVTQELSTGKMEHLHYEVRDKPLLENISSIYKDDKGTIWLGSRAQGAIFSLRMKNNHPVIQYEFSTKLGNPTTRNIIHKITKANGDKIWVVTLAGLYLYNPMNGTYRFFNSQQSDDWEGEPFDMIHYNDTTNWFATAGGGLHKLIHKGDSVYFEIHNSQKGIKSNILFDIELVGEDIWIGSESGVQKYNIPQDSFYRIPVLDQRINGKVLSITHDEAQRIWFSTNDGLFCYAPKTNMLSNYSADEGLLADFEFRSSYRTPQGRVYFGGIDGYVDFKGDDILRTNTDDKTQITDLKIFEKSVVVGQIDPHLDAPILQQSITNTENITLSPKHKTITIEYSVLDYLAPHQYEYAYMLEGFEDDWKFVGKKTSVTYTNLRPGEYTFHIKARSKTGNWTPVKELNIEVLVPYWQQWWFILGCICLLSLCIYAYMRYREYNIRNENEKLDKLVKQRTEALDRNIKELQESEATLHKKNIELQQLLESNTELEQFARAVAHDLKQPIRSIEGFSSLLKRKLEKKEVLGETEKEFFGLIKQGVLNMDQLITGLLEYSKVSSSQGDKFSTFSTEEIILTVKSNLSQQIEESGTTLTYDHIPSQVYGVQVKLVQLFQNLISNSIKFRKKDEPCTIKISAEEQRRHWLFRLEDNGIGIPFESRAKVFQVFKRAHANYEGTGIGLATCKRIIQQHGGDIWVDSEFEGGAIFYFYIQKRVDKESLANEFATVDDLGMMRK